MSTELVAIERIIIGKGEKGAEQVRKDLARLAKTLTSICSIYVNQTRIDVKVLCWREKFVNCWLCLRL